MQVYSCIVCLFFAWQGTTHLAPFILPHHLVGPSSFAPNCCSGLCFGRCLSIARAIDCLFAALNIGDGWMFWMLELVVDRR